MGKVTDTQDITGTVLEEKDVKVTEEAVRGDSPFFCGGTICRSHRCTLR